VEEFTFATALLLYALLYGADEIKIRWVRQVQWFLASRDNMDAMYQAVHFQSLIAHHIKKGTNKQLRHIILSPTRIQKCYIYKEKGYLAIFFKPVS
jgi:hypothetical protein